MVMRMPLIIYKGRNLLGKNKANWKLMQLYQVCLQEHLASNSNFTEISANALKLPDSFSLILSWCKTGI